ncbi:hypothetical protein OAH34_02840 [bacterium]|nr:hypothetical protein [bacterium]
MSPSKRSRTAAIGMAAADAICFVAALCLLLLIATQLTQQTTSDEPVNQNQVKTGEKR